MEKKKIIVRNTSSNFSWAIYGLAERIGWEDLFLLDEEEKIIASVSLNCKSYLRAGLEQIKDDPEEKDFVKTIEAFLKTDKCHYWYHYDQVGAEDFYEVPYDAPKNESGVKPRFVDIWHPDEVISIETVGSAIADFCKKHLDFENYEIEIQNAESIEEAIESFKEHNQALGIATPADIEFSDELLEGLSERWKQPTEAVIERLQKLLGQTTNF